MAGVVRFTLKQAQGVEESDRITHNDLYAIIIVGGKRVAKTKYVRGGLLQGWKYTWNETYTFNVTTTDRAFEVQLWDKDIGFDDQIGTATFSLTKARQSGVSDEVVPVVTKKKKEMGTLSATIKFERSK